MSFTKSGREWIFAFVNVTTCRSIIEAAKLNGLGTFLEQNQCLVSVVFDEPDAGAAFERAIGIW
jgi:hypothetical protein